MSDFYRVAPDDFQILNRAQGGDGRTVIGRALPYGVDQVINRSLTERFERGAFSAQLVAGHRVPFARDHLALGGHIIGKTLELREEDDGLYGKWLISRTALGEETIELLKDGALDQLSIGFRELPGGTRTRNGISVRTRAHLLEVAVVQNGAYGEGAAVSDIRSEVPETPNLAAARSVLSSLPVLPTW